MGITYDRATDVINDFVIAVMQKYHPELHAAGVRIQTLLAYGPVDEKTGEITGPAVKLGGYACAATIRITSLKQRVAGSGDAEMLIDGDRWFDWAESQKTALVDHELQHLELSLDDGGGIITDDNSRPKLRGRLHDWQLGGFKCIAERHGRDSFEVTQMDDLVGLAGDVLFPWMGQAISRRHEYQAPLTPKPAVPQGPADSHSAKIAAGLVDGEGVNVTTKILQAVAAQVNAGAMDSPGMTVTATVNGEAVPPAPAPATPASSRAAGTFKFSHDDLRPGKEFLKVETGEVLTITEIRDVCVCERAGGEPLWITWTDVFNGSYQLLTA